MLMNAVSNYVGTVLTTLRACVEPSNTYGPAGVQLLVVAIVKEGALEIGL